MIVLVVVASCGSVSNEAIDGRAYLRYLEGQPTVELLLYSSGRFPAVQEVHLDGRQWPVRSIVESSASADLVTLQLDSDLGLIRQLADKIDSMAAEQDPRTDISFTGVTGDGQEVDLSLTWVGWDGPLPIERMAAQEDVMPLPAPVDDYVLQPGEIGEDILHLSKGPKPYLVERDLVIEVGVKLVIEPGVQLQFAQDAGIIIHGTIVAEGTPEQPITFLPHAGTAKWKNIQIIGSFSKLHPELALNPEINSFSYCHFQGGSGRLCDGDADKTPFKCEPPDIGGMTRVGGAIGAYRRLIEIHNSVFRDNTAVKGGAVFLRNGGTSRIQNNLFISNRTAQGAFMAGGAIKLYGTNAARTHARLVRNSFIHNEAVQREDGRVSRNQMPCGGALYSGYYSAGGILANLFHDNQAGLAGGGAYFAHDKGGEMQGFLTQRLVDNLFVGNRAGRGGGLGLRVDFSASEFNLENNWFVGHRPLAEDLDESRAGGVITLEDVKTSRLVGNLVVGNQVREKGSAIVVLGFENLSQTKIQANRILDNRTEAGPAIELQPEPLPERLAALQRQLLASDNLIQGNEPTDDLGGPDQIGLSDLWATILAFLSTLAHQMFNIVMSAGLFLLILWISPVSAIVVFSFINLLPFGRGILRLIFVLPGLGRRIVRPYLNALQRIEVGDRQLPDALVSQLKDPGFLLIRGSWEKAGSLVEFLTQTSLHRLVDRVPVGVLGPTSAKREEFAQKIGDAMTDLVRAHGKGWRARLVARIGFPARVISELFRNGVILVVAGLSEARPPIAESEHVMQLFDRFQAYHQNIYLVFVEPTTDMKALPPGTYSELPWP